jgi:hypothetical protein
MLRCRFEYIWINNKINGSALVKIEVAPNTLVNPHILSSDFSSKCHINGSSGLRDRGVSAPRTKKYIPPRDISWCEEILTHESVSSSDDPEVQRQWLSQRNIDWIREIYAEDEAFYLEHCSHCESTQAAWNVTGSEEVMEAKRCLIAKQWAKMGQVWFQICRSLQSLHWREGHSFDNYIAHLPISPA